MKGAFMSGCLLLFLCYAHSQSNIYRGEVYTQELRENSESSPPASSHSLERTLLFYLLEYIIQLWQGIPVSRQYNQGRTKAISNHVETHLAKTMMFPLITRDKAPSEQQPIQTPSSEQDNQDGRPWNLQWYEQRSQLCGPKGTLLCPWYAPSRTSSRFLSQQLDCHLWTRQTLL